MSQCFSVAFRNVLRDVEIEEYRVGFNVIHSCRILYDDIYE